MSLRISNPAACRQNSRAPKRRINERFLIFTITFLPGRASKVNDRLSDPGPIAYHRERSEKLRSNEISMPIVVEFFGIPRARTGVERTTAHGSSLGDVLEDVAIRFPTFAEACLQGRAFRPGFTANLKGERFTTNPETELHDGDVIYVLSLDAGG